MNDTPSPRIVSLLPSATEIVYALGFGPNLVGRSHECDYPDEVKSLPACTATQLLPGLSSKAIDDSVKALLHNSLSVYSVDRELIKQLNPDVLITQDQCEACAVNLKEVAAALQHLLAKPATLLSLQPQTIGDIFADIARVAECIGAQSQAADLLEQLNERLDIIAHKLRFTATRPTIACIEWIEPLMLAGNWMPQLMAAAGGQPIPAEGGHHSAYTTVDELLQHDPDILVLTPCGFGIDRTLAEMDTLLSLPGFAALKAVQDNQLYIADGNQYFNRPGPRIVDSAEILAEIMYPKQFAFGYEGSGWIRFGV